YLSGPCATGHTPGRLCAGRMDHAISCRNGCAWIGAAAFLTAAILALPGLFRLVFGRELFLGSWRCEIAANSSPDGVDGVQVKTLTEQAEPSRRKLRHALYSNADVPACILEWLNTD